MSELLNVCPDETLELLNLIIELLETHKVCTGSKVSALLALTIHSACEAGVSKISLLAKASELYDDLQKISEKEELETLGPLAGAE